MAKKKIPTRKCVGCGEMKERTLLCRVIRNKQGEFLADPKGKAEGRSAYICKDPACLQIARKKKGLERAFSGAIPEEIYATLERVCVLPAEGEAERTI